MDNRGRSMVRTAGILAAIIIGLLIPSGAQGQQSGFATVEAYTYLPVGVRAIGLKGAFVAVANDPATLWHNPSGMAQLAQYPQISVMTTAMSFGRMFNALTYAQQVVPSFGIGAGVIHYRSGRFTARQRNGQVLGEYTNDQFLAQAGVAYQIAAVTLGVSGKYLLNLLRGSDIRGDGYAFDVGMLIRAPFFAVGLAARNVLGTMIWNNADRLKETLRYSIHAGVAVEIPFRMKTKVIRVGTGAKKRVRQRSRQYALLTMEAQWVQQEAHLGVMFGAEIVPVEELQFRLGFPIVQPTLDGLRYFPVADFALGLSFQPKIPDLPFFLQIDYAVSQDYVTTASRLNHHFGLTLLWW